MQTKISINIIYFSLNQIDFLLSDTSIALGESDLNILLNKSSFFHFSLIKNMDNTYSLTPNTQFSQEDELVISISSDDYYSFPVKIIFKIMLSDSSKDITYTLPDFKGDMMLTLEHINSLPFSLSSESFHITSAPDSLTSTISINSSNHGVVFKDTPFDIDLELLDIDEENLTSGYYQLNVESSPKE